MTALPAHVALDVKSSDRVTRALYMCRHGLGWAVLWRVREGLHVCSRPALTSPNAPNWALAATFPIEYISSASPFCLRVNVVRAGYQWIVIAGFVVALPVSIVLHSYRVAAITLICRTGVANPVVNVLETP